MYFKNRIALTALILTLVSAMNLAAQAKTNLEKGFPFRGFWQRAPNSATINQAVDCGPSQGGGGRCSIPLPQMKPLFRPRMMKWMQTYGIHDEGLGGAYECAATPFPSSLEDPTIIRVASEQEMHFEGAWDNDYVRTVYMDGRKFSDGLNRLTYQGESIGHFEGDDLVIVSTNFTFDPDGLDDHLHLPSSPRKKVTVRYHLTSPDKMTMTITYEDSLFLKAPYTWSLQMQHSDQSKVNVFGLPFEPSPCSLEAAHAELDLFDDQN
jgi:hypothetical protein